MVLPMGLTSCCSILFPFASVLIADTRSTVPLPNIVSSFINLPLGSYVYLIVEFTFPSDLRFDNSVILPFASYLKTFFDSTFLDPPLGNNDSDITSTFPFNPCTATSDLFSSATLRFVGVLLTLSFVVVGESFLSVSASSEHEEKSIAAKNRKA